MMHLPKFQDFIWMPFFVGARNNVPNMKGVKEVFVGGDYFQENFEGLISGLEIYKYSLPADEILRLYHLKQG